MLPKILPIAEEYGLIINQRTIDKKEAMCKCPFCLQDSNAKKYYLSLNTESQVFKCWYCKESGGVFRFISLLTGQPESEVIEKHRVRNGKRRRKIFHPAERLTGTQLKMIGYRGKPNWFELKKRDYAYFKRTLDNVWSNWQDFLDIQRRRGFQMLLMGIKTGKYQKALRHIDQKSKEIGYNLLPEIFAAYSNEKRPIWAQGAEILVNEIYNKMPNRLSQAIA